MTVPDDTRAHRERCAAHLARLRMLAAHEPGLTPASVTPQISQVTSMILAEAESAGQALVASTAGGRRGPQAARFLSARLARMAAAAQDATAAAGRGDAAALRRHLHRFEALITAMWTVQVALRPRHPNHRRVRLARRSVGLARAAFRHPRTPPAGSPGGGRAGPLPWAWTGHPPTPWSSLVSRAAIGRPATRRQGQRSRPARTFCLLRMPVREGDDQCMASQGHRTVPHTADLRIEAWAPTREACLAEAARGLVDSFAVTTGARPRRTARRQLTVRSDEDLLVAVIDEIIYWLDAAGEIPVTVTVRQAPERGVDLELSLADVSAAEITGAVPKAASLHELRCAPDAAGQWRCSVTIDV